MPITLLLHSSHAIYCKLTYIISVNELLDELSILRVDLNDVVFIHQIVKHLPGILLVLKYNLNATFISGEVP